MNKNIVIFGINYYPEDSAIGLYTTQKSEYLVKKGYNVTVVTGFPYYPQWKIYEAYKKKSMFYEENINGVRVIRFKQFVPEKPTFFNRILLLLTFTIGSFFNLFKISKPSLVISVIPFTSSVLLGLFLKIRYQAKLWIHIQDFEFDAAVESGILNKKTFFFKVLIWIEKKLLNSADRVSTISHGMIKILKRKTNSSTYYLPNWIDTSLFSEKFTAKHHLLKSKKFKILYSGNIGVKQDWSLFADLIKELRDYHDIEFIIVGDGAEKDNFVKKVINFPSVKYNTLVPYSDLPKLLASTDMHILLLKSDVIDTVMPSKLIGMMASGKPSIVTGNLKSEVNKVIKQSNGGFYLDGKSIDDIKKHILLLKENDKLINEIGQNASVFINRYYSKDVILGNFLKEINTLTF